MSLGRDRDLPIQVPQERDMPPLVHHPHTYTFFPEITPLSFPSTSAPTPFQNQHPAPADPHSSANSQASPPPSPITPDDSSPSVGLPMVQTRTHGKRRDPSYIPRSPNAFILFRSAFIRDQNVPGKVEGNHSTLSKIIGTFPLIVPISAALISRMTLGLCWRQLSPAERKEWEDKARVAQEEHRARYPHWRFRPAANALAKLKIQEAAASSSRRRTGRRAKESSDGDEDDASTSNPDGSSKGRTREAKGKTKSVRLVDEETRCATIAGFVVEGIKGEELEAAVKEWEGSRSAVPPVRSSRSRSVRGTQASGHARSQSSTDHIMSPQSASLRHDQSSSSIDSVSIQQQPTQHPHPAGTAPGPPNPSVGTLAEVPLTHMFKRSVSAPAPGNRLQQAASPSEASDECSSGDQSPLPGSGVEPHPESAWPRTTPAAVQPSNSNQYPSSTDPFPAGARRDSAPLPYDFPPPAPTPPSRPSYDQPSIAWQEPRRSSVEQQIPASDPWWQNTGSPADRPSYDYTETPRECMVDRMSTERMGFQGQQHQYSGYIGDYGTYSAPAPPGASQWTNLSTQSDDRQGLATVLEDPYKDSQAPTSVPATLSIPSLSDTSSSFYQTQTHAVNTSPLSSPTFSSSYSTLSHWDNYKTGGRIASDLRAWPERAMHVQDASPWYQPDGSTTWGHIRPELQHHGVSMDAQDWDRAEYRAGRSLHLDVGPQREATSFTEELHRLHQHGNGA